MQVVNNLVEWNANHGLPQTTSFRYSDSFKTAEDNADDREAIWKTGTFNASGRGLAMLQQLPLGFNLVQIEVNGEQVISRHLLAGRFVLHSLELAFGDMHTQ